MRNFFIRSFETLINFFVVVAIVILVLFATAALLGFGDMHRMDSPPRLLFAAAVLLGGGIYLILIAGFLYLVLGIYDNTRRAAEALEKMASR